MLGTKFAKGSINREAYIACAEWCNENNATIVDKGEYFECVNVDKKQPEIEELKRKLQETDYVVVKIAEGVATKTEYKSILEKRKQWRKAINDYEVCEN